MGPPRLLQTTAYLALAVGCYASSVANTSCDLVGPQVVLPQATVRGFLDSHNNLVYLGIPYAQTTGGQNRYHSSDSCFPTCTVLRL